MELTESLKKVLSEAYPNNSFDIPPLNDSLNHTLENSFGYLYRLQRALIEYEELHYFSNDENSHNTKTLGRLYLDKHIRACIDVEYDLIHVSERESFRRSRFYLNEFSFNDIIENTDIFKKIPIILIDDKVIYNFKMKMVNGNTHIILPYHREFVLKKERNKKNDDIIYIDHKVQILTVDNMYFQEFETVKSFMEVDPLQDADAPYKNVTVHLADSFVFRGLPDDAKGIFFASFLVKKEDDWLETPLNECEFDGTTLKVKMVPSVYNELQKTSDRYKMHVIFMNDLNKYTYYTGKDYTIAKSEKNCLDITKTICTDLAVITDPNNPGETYPAPIPIENLMILSTENGTDGLTLEYNRYAATLHYPNIYEIVDDNIKIGNTYQLYYFYKKQSKLRYIDVHYFYYDFIQFKFNKTLDELINKIYYNKMTYENMDDTSIKYFKDLFAKIFIENVYNHEYGDIDYTRKYKLEKENLDKLPKEYKIERMREFIREDPWVLKDYVFRQNKVGRLFHMFTVNVDLPKRLRNDTSEEFPNSKVVFDEPMYVFAFSNGREYGLDLVCSVFVDGLHVDELYKERLNFLEYLYIPKRMVTSDSFIEIEVFDDYDFTKTMKFDSMDDEITVEIPTPEHESVFPLLSDVYFYSENKDQRQWISDKCFRFTAIYDDYKLEVPLVTTDEEKPIYYTKMIKVKIKPLMEAVVGKDLMFCISKQPYSYPVQVKTDGYPQLLFDAEGFKPDVDYLQIYVNGRLLPKEYYSLIYATSQPMLQVHKYLKKGDIFYLTISPYRSKEIYYQEELEKGQTLIDLTNYITKPFDIRYYDVYMNGRRLGINNVFAISPTVITLVNLKSLYNLSIFERDRDWEYFGLKPDEFKRHITIPDLLDYPFVSEDEKNKYIERIIDKLKDPDLTIHPNENFEEKEDHNDDKKALADILNFYFYELIPKTFSNPDQKQFDCDLVSRHYPTIAKYFMEKPTEGIEYPSDIERKKAYCRAILLNPDNELRGAKNTMDCSAYVVGHYQEYTDDDVFTEDMLKNQSVDMIDDSLLITGGDK